MRILLAFVLLFITTLSASSQALWRNFFTINQNPIVDVVAGSNATVQASTPAVNIRRFTVNGVTDTNVVGLILTNTVNGMLSTNVAAWAQSATNARYVTTAVLTNKTYASNVVSGGIITIDAMATNSPWANSFLKGATGTRFWSQDGMGLTNLQGSNIVGTITVDTLNVGDLIVTNPPYLNLGNSTNLPYSSLSNAPARSVGITIDGGGSAVTAGTKGYIEVPYAGTIKHVAIFADQVGSIAIQTWRTNYIGFPPTLSGVLFTNYLTSTNWSRDEALTGAVSTSISTNDILAFNVITNASAATRVTLQLKVQP